MFRFLRNIFNSVVNAGPTPEESLVGQANPRLGLAAAAHLVRQLQ